MLFIGFKDVKNLNLGLSKSHNNGITSKVHYVYNGSMDETVDIISVLLVFNYPMSVKGEQII